MRLVLDKIDEMQSGNLKLKQFAGDLANTLKSTYENKIRPALGGGQQGAGAGGASFLDGLGLTGLAQAYKGKAEEKEQRRQDKEKFVGNFQKYSEAGKNLSGDTSRQVAETMFEDLKKMKEELMKLEGDAKNMKEAGYGEDPENKKQQEELIAAIKALNPANKATGTSDEYVQQASGRVPENKKQQEQLLNPVNKDPSTASVQEKERVPENKKQQEQLLNAAENDNAARDQSIQQVQGEEKATEVAVIAAKSFEVETKQSEDLTALYTITDDFFKKQDKRTEEMLEALKTIAEKDFSGGGGDGGLLDIADDMMGRGRKGPAGKVPGKAPSKLARLASVGKGALIGSSVLAVGAAAYEGYNEYQDADQQVKTGEITKETGQVKKGEAVGGGVGAVAGSLAGAKVGAMGGAALGTMIFPGVGTVVGGALGGIAGGALGYFGGKKAGQAVGGTGVEGYQKVTGSQPTNNANTMQYDAMGNATGMASESPTSSTDKNAKLSRDWAWSIMTEQAGDKKPDPAIKDQVDSIMKNDTQLKEQAAKFLENKKRSIQPIVQTQPSMAGAEMKSANKQLENTRDAVASNNNSTSNTVVNAPVTNVSNTNNNGENNAKKNTRNEDTTFNRYMQGRYYPASRGF